MKKQELNEKEISLSKIEAESRLGCAKSRTCKHTMIVNMFAMKTKFLTAITCFLVAAIPVVAQNTESGKDNKEVLNDWDVYEKYQVKEFPYSNLRGKKHMNLPERVIKYGAHEVKARAYVEYSSDSTLKGNTFVKLNIFLTPSNTDGFDAQRKDSIAKYGTYNTVVMHNSIGKTGETMELTGKADVYARAFSPGKCTAADKARLEYAAKVDFEHPDNSSVEYKLTETEWAPADPLSSVSIPDMRARYSGFMTCLLHGIDPGYGGSIDFGNGRYSKATEGSMAVRLDYLEKTSDKEEELVSRVSDKNIRNLRLRLFLDGRFVYDFLYPSGEKRIVGSPITDEKFNFDKDRKYIVFTEARKADGKVTAQYDDLELDSRLPFVGKNKKTKIDVRAHADCGLSESFKDEYGIRRFFCNRVTFSCLIHD